MSAKPYLTAKHDQIKLLAENGVAAPDIAKITESCVSGIRKYCAKNGIALVNIKDIFPKRKDEFLEKVKETTDTSELIAHFGVSQATIRRWGLKVGVLLTDSYHKGFIETHNGYLRIKASKHPCADTHGYVLHHRLMMEAHIGRYLTPDEVVHHKDGDKQNNQIENLELMSKSEHARLHAEAGETGWAFYHANAI